jgi:hypothetical protein
MVVFGFENFIMSFRVFGKDVGPGRTTVTSDLITRKNVFFFETMAIIIRILSF